MPYPPSPTPSTSPQVGLDTPAKVNGSTVFPSPMYEGLETNIPHVLMKYSDDDSLENDQLFPSHSSVLQYLQNYGADVEHLVRFNTQVQSIQNLQVDKQEQWSVASQNLVSHKSFEEVYDAIVIASGHYTIPYLPGIEGISDWNKWYPGSIVHSREYERPTDFAGKKVIVVGNSASGLDICSQIGRVSQQPIIISAKSISEMQGAFASDGRLDLPEIQEFLPPSRYDRAVRFIDGRIESGIDSIVFCTGYFYSYPFLSSIQPPLIESGKRVQNLYQHILSIDHPSLAFVGLPQKIIPFRTCEGQAGVISRLWAERISLPSRAEMRKWEEARLAQVSDEKSFHVFKSAEDLDYHNMMVDWALTAQSAQFGKLPPKWSPWDYWARRHFPDARRAFAAKGEAKTQVRTIADVGLVFSD